jgi:DNA ligase 4
MSKPTDRLDRSSFFGQLTERGIDLDELPGVMFRHCTVYFDKTSDSDDMDLDLAQRIVRFASGQVVDNVEDPKVTHIVVGNDLSRLKQLRQTISKLVLSPIDHFHCSC